MSVLMRWPRTSKRLLLRLAPTSACRRQAWGLIIFAVMAGCFVASAWGVDVAEKFKPNIYVPYQDLAHLIDPADKAVLMDRAEFEKLLSAAEANAREADILELGQVKHAEYSAEISGEELTLTGELEVVSMGDGPVAVPLGFARMGLTRVVMDGKPAPLGYDKQGKLTLIVTAKGSHQLEIAGTTKLKELTSGGMQFGISLPPAVAGTMKLSAAGDLEIHATVPVSQPAYDKETDCTNVELTIGGQDSLTVVLLGNGRQEDDRPILLGESAATVSLTRSHQVMGCLYTVQVLRRGVRELQFQLPPEWTVTEVTCPSLVRWSVATVVRKDSIGENETGQGSKILSVRLRSAKIGTTALHIKATAPRMAGIWHGPRVILVGAAFQRGYLMVTTDEGLAVRGEKLTGVRREDVSAAASVPGMVSAAAGRLYFHWGDNWLVDLELATVALRRSIKEQQRLLCSPEQVTLTGDFEVTAIDRELFDISLVLGGSARQWQIKTVQVDGKSAGHLTVETGFEYRIEEQAGRRLLRIELPRPVRPEKLVNVKIVLQNVPSDWHWPSDAPERSITVPLIESQARTVSGHVSISAVGDLDALPEKLPGGLEVVPVGRMASLGMPGEVQYAYSYKAAVKGEIQLRVSRRRPRIAGEAVGLITVRPREFTGDWRVTYIISRASARRLYLLADKSLARKIKITSPAVPISSKSIVKPDEKTLSLPAELAQRYNLWSLNLDHKAIGAVAIDVHYERPRTSDKFVVPLVRPICDGQITEQLAVQASEELALTINAAGAKEIDAVDLPPLPVAASRILAAFRLQAAATPTRRTAPAVRRTEAAVTLGTAVHEGYRVPSALAVSAELTTYLDVQGGQRTEATFRIANAGRQFLTFRLPEGAQLWSLSVAGRQAKPQRSAQGDYQVPLGQFRKPVPVKIVYLWQSYAYQPGKARLKRLQVGGVELPGVEINEMSWNIVPPPGYQITAQETKMQTDDLVRPTPAYVQLYNFLAENLFSGSLLMPSLSRVRRVALSAKFQLAGEDIERVHARAVGAKDEPAPPPLTRPSGKPATQKAKPPAVSLRVRLVEEGRFTLPVDLVPTPGAGRSAKFTGLGTAKLIVGLTSQSRQTGWWALGFVLIAVIGVALAWQKVGVRVKAILFVAVLSFASLMAIWWPTTTHFANGAFTAGVCLVPLYVLIWLIRWLWKKLCLGGGAVGPEPVTVVTLLVLLLCLGCSAQTAYAAQPGRANPGLVRTSASSVESQGDDKAALPPVIIPYEGDPATAEKSEKILIPYTRFVRLWNQAHPDDPIDRPRPGTDVSLASVRYRVTVEKEQLNLLLTADIRTYGKDWVVLAMPIEGLAVTEATIDGKAAPVASFCEAKLRGQAGPKGMVLMLPGQISGRLQLSAVVKPKFLGRRGSASFSLPPLPGAVMDVVLPEEDLELEVDGIEGALRKESQGLTQRTVNGTVVWTFPLGMARKLTLRWLPKMGEGAADRTLSATSIHDVYAFHWATVAVTKITYSFSGGQHDRFTLLMPEGATLTDLKGTNIRDYRQVGEKIIEGRTFKIIEVRLALPQVHRAAKKQYELTVRWLAPLLGGAGLSGLPTLEKPARLFLVRAGDVSRESGTVTLHSAGGMIVKVAQVTGGRRTSVPVDKELRDTELTADRARAVAKYYWPYRPFSLYLKLSRLTVSPKVNLDQLVRISTDQVQLLVQASLKAERGRLFGASFVLPAGYELLSVVGPAVENFYERQDVKGSFLHVKFQSAVRETKMALVLVRSDVQLEDFQVPTIMFIDSGVHPLPGQEGRVAVQVAASLEARTLASENLKPIAPRTLQDWLDTNQLKAVQFAYRYEAATPSLRLNIRRQPTRVRVEIFAGLSVKATAAAYTYRLRYNITGSPLDRLSFRLPNEYAPLVAVESPAMRSVTQSDAPAPSCEGKSGGQTSWTVSLVNEVTGIVDVTVNFALPIDASTKVLPIPRIETPAALFAKQTAGEGYRAIVAVQNMSRHEIDVNNLTITNLAELPVSEQQKLMPSEMRQSLQYVFQSFEDNWSLGLDFTPAKMAARIQAVVDLLALTTVIDRNGRCRYEARVALQNRSEQFLRVKVPKGLRLWSANVAGQPVKPVTAADSPAGEVLIPLVKTSPGGLPYDVYLYFAGSAVKSLNGITRLKPPAISIVGMPVMQTTWSLRLPDGYRYLRPGGNMSPIAGTVEMLSLSIEARLDQLKRLEKSYRGVIGSFSQRERIARRNWEVFNKKLATEIILTESYLEANSGEVSREDYRRLKSKLGGQKVKQFEIIGGNTAFVRGQQEQARQDMNFFLNASASNPGVAEGIRNAPLLGKPEFVSENEKRQMARLRKELELSEQQRKALEVQKDISEEKKPLIEIHGKEAEGLILESAKKADDMSGILLKLSRESAAQIEQKQEQIRGQLSELADSRMQRYFQTDMDKAQALRLPPKRPAEPLIGGLFRSGEYYYDESGALLRGRQPTAAGRAVTAPEGEAAFGLDMADISVAAGEEIRPYVARGIYSLPVSLPEGEVRLDFARPAGEAQLSLWAVPVSAIHGLYSTLAVIAALFIALGVIKIWPQIWPQPVEKRPISVKRIIVYVLLLVVLTLIVGLLGLLISLFIVLLCEAKRGLFVGLRRKASPKWTNAIKGVCWRPPPTKR